MFRFTKEEMIADLREQIKRKCDTLSKLVDRQSYEELKQEILDRFELEGINDQKDYCPIRNKLEKAYDYAFALTGELIDEDFRFIEEFILTTTTDSKCLITYLAAFARYKTKREDSEFSPFELAILANFTLGSVRNEISRKKLICGGGTITRENALKWLRTKRDFRE